jgi:hypothetical protein
MSDEDRQLLDLAGLSITEAAALLGRSRQSIHKGLKQAYHYFRPPDLLTIARFAEANESNRARLLVHIFHNYRGPDFSAVFSLLQPHEYRLKQLRELANNSSAILVWLCDSLRQPINSVLAPLLQELVERRPADVTIVATNESWQKHGATTGAKTYILWRHEAPVSHVVVFKYHDRDRAFIQTQDDVCELHSGVAHEISLRLYMAGAKGRPTPPKRRKRMAVN